MKIKGGRNISENESFFESDDDMYCGTK